MFRIPLKALQLDHWRRRECGYYLEFIFVLIWFCPRTKLAMSQEKLIAASVD